MISYIRSPVNSPVISNQVYSNEAGWKSRQRQEGKAVISKAGCCQPTRALGQGLRKEQGQRPEPMAQLLAQGWGVKAAEATGENFLTTYVFSQKLYSCGILALILDADS